MFSTRSQRLTPYVPGEQPTDRRYVKLNTNENPYPPGPRVSEALKNYDAGRLKLYPDPLFTELRIAAAKRFAVPKEYVFAGNGSDEVLSFSFFSFFDRSAAFAEHTYSFFPVYCNFYGIQGVTAPLRNDFGIDLGLLGAIPDVDGLVIANPNSPTGMYLSPEEIEGLLKEYPEDRVVILDEAYIGFGGQSCIPLIERYQNLLIIQTFSKSASLAGLRLGLAFGHPDLISALFRAKDAFNSYPVHDLGQKLGIAALEDAAYYDSIASRICETRERVSRHLSDLGWNVAPSMANFIFTRAPGLSGNAVYTELKQRGILVRFFDKPGLKEHVRITIGSDQQMDILLSTLREAGFGRNA